MIESASMRIIRTRSACLLIITLSLAGCLFPLARLGAQAADGLSPVLVVRTERFAIYFVPSMQDQAEKLSKIADSMLDRLESFFGYRHPEKSIPVFITDREPALNGYSTTFPSNRILIFLAGASSLDELSSFEDELESVFLHELVHSLTLNARGGLFGAARLLMGDFVTPAAWIMPKALVEGSSVWFESNESPGVGRLNDPGALEPVSLDIARGEKLDLWDVSGLLDYRNSGALPYLYGGLFVEYLAQKYGKEVLAELWVLAGKGNIARGFDGTWVTKGTLEFAVGDKPDQVWSDFLAWCADRLGVSPGEPESVSSRPQAIESAGDALGPFAVGADQLFYLDTAKRAVFQLALREGAKPQRLFGADGYLEAMRVSADGKTLELDWQKESSSGRLEPASFAWNIEAKRLKYGGDRKVPTPGDNAQLFLYSSWDDPVSGYTYGLFKDGSEIGVARISAKGSMEKITTPGFTPRSLAGTLGDKPGVAFGGASPIIVLSGFLTQGADAELAAGANSSGISRLAFLYPDTPVGDPVFQIQKTPFDGGAHRVAISPDGMVYFVSEGAKGRSSLHRLELEKALASDNFISSRAYVEPRAAPPPPAKARLEQPQGKALFPQGLATSRAIGFDASSVTALFMASDLTERLSWTASLGWDYRLGLPEEAFTISGLFDRHSVSLFFFDDSQRIEASDQTPSAARVLGAAAAYGYSAGLVPSRNRLGFSAIASYSSIDIGYSLEDFTVLPSDYHSTAMSIEASLGSFFSEFDPPYDLIGIAGSLGAQAELVDAKAGALSLSANIEARGEHPLPSLSFHAAWSASPNLAFSPGGRVFFIESETLPSSLSAPYPEFTEYAYDTAASAWYLSGVLEERLFSIETAKTLGIVRMPFLPSWTIRRVTARAGARAALFAPSSDPGSLLMPLALYAKLQIDAALLYGTAATGHFMAFGEISWAFEEKLTGGGRLHFDLGLDMELR